MTYGQETLAQGRIDLLFRRAASSGGLLLMRETANLALLFQDEDRYSELDSYNRSV